MKFTSKEVDELSRETSELFSNTEHAEVQSNSKRKPRNVPMHKNEENASCRAEDRNRNTVSVMVRVRALNNHNAQEKSIEIAKTNSVILRRRDRQYTHSFNTVFGEGSSQEDVYGRIQPLLSSSILDSKNLTIFAYGQTGTGKTYTMSGETETIVSLQSSHLDDSMSHAFAPLGIIPRSCYDTFKVMESQQQQQQFSVHATYLEVYNEQIYDLLTPSKRYVYAPRSLQAEILKVSGKTIPKHLLKKCKRVRKRQSNQPHKEDLSEIQVPGVKLKQDLDGSIFVPNLRSVSVSNAKDLLKVFLEGSKQRVVVDTELNDHSSRSHAVFQIHIVKKDFMGSSCSSITKLSFVDLAGSEKCPSQTVSTRRKRELISINKSLSSLSRCMTVLSKLSATSSLSANTTISHIPYRDSTLTRLLQDSLNGASRTVFIITVTPSTEAVEETYCSLKFGDNAKKVTLSKISSLITPHRYHPERTQHGPVSIFDSLDTKSTTTRNIMERSSSELTEEVLKRIIGREANKDKLRDMMARLLDREDIVKSSSVSPSGDATQQALNCETIASLEAELETLRSALFEEKKRNVALNELMTKNLENHAEFDRNAKFVDIQSVPQLPTATSGINVLQHHREPSQVPAEGDKPKIFGPTDNVSASFSRLQEGNTKKVENVEGGEFSQHLRNQSPNLPVCHNLPQRPHTISEPIRVQKKHLRGSHIKEQNFGKINQSAEENRLKDEFRTIGSHVPVKTPPKPSQRNSDPIRNKSSSRKPKSKLNAVLPAKPIVAPRKVARRSFMPVRTRRFSEFIGKSVFKVQEYHPILVSSSDSEKARVQRDNHPSNSNQTHDGRSGSSFPIQVADSPSVTCSADTGGKKSRKCKKKKGSNPARKKRSAWSNQNKILNLVLSSYDTGAISERVSRRRETMQDDMIQEACVSVLKDMQSNSQFGSSENKQVMRIADDHMSRSTKNDKRELSSECNFKQQTKAVEQTFERTKGYVSPSDGSTGGGCDYSSLGLVSPTRKIKKGKSHELRKLRSLKMGEDDKDLSTDSLPTVVGGGVSQSVHKHFADPVSSPPKTTKHATDTARIDYDDRVLKLASQNYREIRCIGSRIFSITLRKQPQNADFLNLCAIDTESDMELSIALHKEDEKLLGINSSNDFKGLVEKLQVIRDKLVLH